MTFTILNRDGSGEPLLLETEASWMWHSFNAFEQDGTLIADFVGYDNPDHFIGPDPALYAIMEGREGESTFPGTLRRHEIDLQRRTVRTNAHSGEASHEFPPSSILS